MDQDGSLLCSLAGWDVPTLLMEDHRDAYFFWQSLGLRNHMCIHVDAHLDVSDLKAPTLVQGLSPEINCGNYLFPALKEGILSGLVWVIPKHLPAGRCLLEWTREELQNWLYLEVDDYMSLQLKEGRVEGRLLDKPFIVTFCDNLPTLSGPVVLDIDIDYYLDSKDETWQSPLQLAEHLSKQKPAAFTVAYSVQGGYTPIHLRYLGPLTVLAVAKAKKAEECWRQLESEVEATERSPSWLKAALAARRGRLEEAELWDPGYRPETLDGVSAALMRHEYDLARERLECQEESLEYAFFKGMIAFRKGAYGEAVEAWSPLLEEEGLDTRTLSYLLTLCGRANSAAGKTAEAYLSFEQAAGFCRKDPELYYLMARVCRDLGDLEKSAGLYRRSMKSAPRRLESFVIALELVEVYLELDRNGLARQLLLKLLRAEVPGFVKAKAEALLLKSALRKSL